MASKTVPGARCRPNDLAFVVRENSTPENLGRVVRIVRHARPNHKEYRPEDPLIVHPVWLVETTGEPLAVAYVSGAVKQAKRRAYPDCWLQPLRPPSDVDDASRDEPARMAGNLAAGRCADQPEHFDA